MSKFITLHPSFFQKEGFGTLMSHCAVLYCIHKEIGLIPVIPKNNLHTIQHFNQFPEFIYYHHDSFVNFNDIFHIVENKFFLSNKFCDLNCIGLSYENTIKKILSFKQNNLYVTWSLNHSLYDKYLKDIIENLYVFNEIIISRSYNILPKTNKQLIGVCVRNEYRKISCPHTILSIDYYKTAMLNFDIANSKYLFFSDDIIETKKIFAHLEKQFDIEYVQPIQSAIGMCAMSLCDHIICANSSFSYWASMLNKNQNKKIICSPYFIEEKKDRFLANQLNFKWHPSEWISIPLK